MSPAGPMARRRRALLLLLLLTALAPAAQAGEAPIGLAGSEWGYASESGGSMRSVQFGTGGLVSGSGGCNRFTGHYVQRSQSLRISGLALTMMACIDEAVMQREGELLRALEAVRRIEATHLVLRLLDGDGALIAELVRRDWD